MKHSLAVRWLVGCSLGLHYSRNFELKRLHRITVTPEGKVVPYEVCRSWAKVVVAVCWGGSLSHEVDTKARWCLLNGTVNPVRLCAGIPIDRNWKRWYLFQLSDDAILQLLFSLGCFLSEAQVFLELWLESLPGVQWSLPDPTAGAMLVTTIEGYGGQLVHAGEAPENTVPELQSLTIA